MSMRIFAPHAMDIFISYSRKDSDQAFMLGGLLESAGLSVWIDRDAIAKIKNAPLPETFYETLLHALQSSFIYDRLVISWVGDLPQPELAAEVCDFMIRFQEVEWAVCAGVHGEKLIFGAVRFLGFILGALEEDLGVFLSGNIQHRADEACDLARGIQQRLAALGHPAFLPIRE